MAFGSNLGRSLKLYLQGDTSDLEKALKRAEVKVKDFNAGAGGTALRKGGLNTGLLGVAGKTGLITAGAGAAGLALKSVVDAAKNAQVILGQTSVAVEDAGLSWQKYGKQVQDASMTISKSSAFDDEQVMQSFSLFVRGQKDVSKSIRLTALAADVARGRYIGLDQATILVNKAAMGQIGQLRRVGIQIRKNATATEALTALERAYGGAAERYSNSAAGAQDRLRVSVENLRESLGSKLLPPLTFVVNAMSDGVDGADKFGSALAKVGVTGKTVGDALKTAFYATPGFGPMIGELQLINRLFGDTKKQLQDIGPLAAQFAATIGGINLNPAGNPSVTNPSGAATPQPGVPGPGKLQTQIPNRMRSALAVAQRTPSRQDDLKVLGQIKAFLTTAIQGQKGRLKSGQEAALQQDLTSIVQQIDGIYQDQKQAVQDARDKAKQKADEFQASLSQLPGAMQLREENALASKSLADDLKVYMSELAHLRSNMAKATSDAVRADIRSAMTAVQSNIQSVYEAMQQAADAFKSKALDRLSRMQQKLTVDNDLRKAQDAYKQALIVGAPGATREALFTLRVAKLQQQQNRLENANVKPNGSGYMIVMNGVTIQANNVNQLIAQLSKMAKSGAPQSRGRAPGNAMGFGW